MSCRHSLACLLAVLLCFEISAGPVAACSCASSTPQKAIESAKFVFSGKVTDVKRDANGLTATVHVDRVWKGDVGKDVVVRTAPDGASCGVNFVKGDNYFIYANANGDTPGALRTNICTRTCLLADAKDDLAVHGEGKPPRDAGKAHE